jgi:hypothetical protein
MADVFTRVQRELQDRLRRVEAELAATDGLRAEKAQIEHALALPPFVDAEPARARTSARPSRPRAPKVRAPRGANRAAVVAAVERMPGATAGEIAAAARVGRAQVYALLRAGVERGALRVVELAGGQNGYQVARPVESAFPPTPPADPDTAPPTASVSRAKRAATERGAPVRDDLAGGD